MPQTLLGFDFGENRTGVAVGETLTGNARALVTLTSKQGKPDWPGIEALLQEWQPDALVVGIPVHMDGTEQPMTAAARKFARQLHGRFKLPVHEAEERLSSDAAETALGHSGGHVADKAAIDREAARIILEDWLRQHS